MTEAYLCDGLRTPIGRYGGALASVRPDDMLAQVMRDLAARNAGLKVDEVMMGCANQAGEDNRNVARMAALLSGLGEDVPGMTINRLCGSGLDAVGTAARAVKSGEVDVVMAGGVESMSRAPLVMPKAPSGENKAATAVLSRAYSLERAASRLLSCVSAKLTRRPWLEDTSRARGTYVSSWG